MYKSMALLVLALALSPAVAAHWTLDNAQSHLSFVSIKAGNIGEVHQFTSLAGGISKSGALEVTIELASVDTLIPIRDERMRSLLFQTDLFPKATFTAQLDPKTLDAVQVGQQQTFSVSGRLNLKDKQLPLNLEVAAVRFAPESVMVTTVKPVLVNAAVAGLTEGVEKLREVAGLPSISPEVPVTMVLTFTR